MSDLEKIIYLADMIEAGRKPFDGIDEIRKTAYEDLDKAVYTALKHTIDFNTEKKRIIHPLSLSALKYYSRE